MIRLARRPGLAAAFLRLLLLPVIFIAEELVDHRQISASFAPTFALACAYAVATLVSALTERRAPSQSRIEPILDLAFLCALDFASGGALSQVRKAFFVFPLAAAATARPRKTALWGLLAVAGFLAVSLPHPDARDPGGNEFMVVEALYLAWTAVAASLLAYLLAIRDTRIARLADDRRRLLAQTLVAVEHERKRFSYQLHDESVQSILVAKRELQGLATSDEHRRDSALQALATGLDQLRATIFELQPLTLEGAGLLETIRQLADQETARSGIEIVLTIDPGATCLHDGVLYTIIRELLRNAARHAHASRVEIVIEQHDGDLIAEVGDDGCGIPAGRREQARADGHIGLAASAERIEALDGTFGIDTAADRGTIVTVRIPLRRHEHDEPQSRLKGYPAVPAGSAASS